MVKISKIFEKSKKKKITFFSKKKKKKSYPLSFPILGGPDSTRAFHSSPFQNPGGVPYA